MYDWHVMLNKPLLLYQPFILTCNLTNFVRNKRISCRLENHTWVFMHALNVFTHIPLCFITCISWCGTRHTRTKHSQHSMKFQIVAYYAKWKFTNNTKHMEWSKSFRLRSWNISQPLSEASKLIEFSTNVIE